MDSKPLNTIADLFDDGLLDYDDAMETNESVVSVATVSPTQTLAVVPVIPEVVLVPEPVPSPTIPAIESTTVTNPVVTVPTPSFGQIMTAREPLRCPICNKNHPLRFCYRFRDMSMERRLRTVARFRLCGRCLSSGHITRNCKSVATCGLCKEGHNTLLHEHKGSPRKRLRRERPATSSIVSIPIRQSVAFSPTLRLNICQSRKKIHVRAVLDACCQGSYICNTLVSQLRLPCMQVDEKRICRVQVESIHDSTQRIFLTAQVRQMERIRTPPVSVSDSILESFQGLQLADPNFNHAGTVALVLGPEVIPLIMKGRIQSAPGLPLAQYTVFGWVISGLSPF